MKSNADVLITTHTSVFINTLGDAMAVASKEVATKKKPLTKQRQVVVTGMGTVTPLGRDPDIFYNNLLEGVSGISEIEAFDCAQFMLYLADGGITRCGVLIGSAIGGLMVR